MLSRILALLEERGALTVDELVRETGVTREALEGMLGTLERRRLIDRQHGVTGAGFTAGGKAMPGPPIVSLVLPKNKAPS